MQTDPVSAYVTDAEVHSILTACRVLTAVAARSVASGQRVNPADLRVLLVVAERQPADIVELATVAEANPATLRATVERLVAAGMIACAAGERDAARLALTEEGRHTLTAAIGRRRQALDLIAQRMPALRRAEVTAVLGGDALQFGPVADRALGAVTVTG